MHPHIVSALWSALVLALARPPVPPPAAPPTPDQPNTLLRGPEIPDRVSHTLVHYDARGKLVRVEGRPEIAALALLEIDQPTQDRAREITIDRATAIGILLIENIDRVAEITDAIGGGGGDNRERAAAIGLELYKLFEPDAPRSPLIIPFRDVLPPEAHAELTRLVEEYWQAWIDRELRNSKDKSDEARKQVEQRLTTGLFNDEIRAAYERTLHPYRERLEAIDRAVEPTPEQRAAIRRIYIDFIRRTRLQPTPEQRREALKDIYRELDPDRRTKFFELVIQQL